MIGLASCLASPYEIFHIIFIIFFSYGRPVGEELRGGVDRFT